MREYRSGCADARSRQALRRRAAAPRRFGPQQSPESVPTCSLPRVASLRCRWLRSPMTTARAARRLHCWLYPTRKFGRPLELQPVGPELDHEPPLALGVAHVRPRRASRSTCELVVRRFGMPRQGAMVTSWPGLSPPSGLSTGPSRFPDDRATGKNVNSTQKTSSCHRLSSECPHLTAVDPLLVVLRRPAAGERGC